MRNWGAARPTIIPNITTMKNIIQKVQDLSHKAAQIKQAIEAAPAQAAQLRETVLMTAGQLQQMRHEVQSSVTGLRADNEDRLTQALRELNDGADTFLEAGYQLIGVDMEVSPVQRLVVHLAKVESVPEAMLRSLASSHTGQPTISGLLSSLAKAEALTAKMHLSNLSYRELVVHVGPTPSVRLCWHADEVIESGQAQAHPARPAPATVASTPPPIPAFTQSSYFEARPTPHATPPAQATGSPVVEPSSAAAPAVTATPKPAVKVVTGSDWKQSALERFKKMPDASKYRR